MDNILNPLRQYVLHVRSKDVEREGLLNSHIFVDMAEPINIDARNEEIHQIILSAELPYSFYNILFLSQPVLRLQSLLVVVLHVLYLMIF